MFLARPEKKVEDGRSVFRSQTCEIGRMLLFYLSILDADLLSWNVSR